MGYQDHQQRAQAEVAPTIRCGIITVSDTRTQETDTSGAAIRTALTQAGHDVVRYELVQDEPAQIAQAIQMAVATGCQVIVTNGGTGITRRDSTIEVVDGLLEKPLPGFGEIFRVLSYQEIGPAAMLSRATGGVYRGSLIFCLPGSPGAVRLAMEKLILPDLHHLVWETIRQ